MVVGDLLHSGSPYSITEKHMNGWRDIAEKAATIYCGKGVPPTDTIRKNASGLSKEQITRACEAANHQINSTLLKNGSRYPKFPLANAEKINPMRKKANAVAVPIRQTGTYQSGDELADQYELLFEEKAAFLEEEVVADLPSRGEITVFSRDVSVQLGGELILAQDSVEKCAEDFVDEIRATMWETPPEVAVRAVVDVSTDEPTKIWALQKVAAHASELGERFDEQWEIPDDYNKESSLVRSYTDLENAFTTLRTLTSECALVEEKLAAMTPENALDTMIFLSTHDFQKLSFLGGMLGKVFGAGMTGAMMAPSMAQPAAKINNMKSQYDQAGFGRPPAPPSMTGTF